MKEAITSSGRGLVKGDDCQVFEIVISQSQRNEFREIYYKKVRKTIMQHQHAQ